MTASCPLYSPVRIFTMKICVRWTIDSPPQSPPLSTICTNSVTRTRSMVTSSIETLSVADTLDRYASVSDTSSATAGAGFFPLPIASQSTATASSTARTPP